MNTDKEIYLIFSRCPEFISLLSRLPSPGKSVVKSVNLKALSRTADGVEIPENPAKPIRVVEVQFQLRKQKANIYRRLVSSMVLIQEEHPNRGVEGIIFFSDKTCDPKTEPWNDWVHVIYLDQVLGELEKSDPNHPVVAVFKPVFEEDTDRLVKTARKHYRRIARCNLPKPKKETLAHVFEHWLLERVPNLSKKEIAMILDLTDIRQTRCGKELLEEGRNEGTTDVLVAQLRHRLKSFPKTVEKRIRSLDAETLAELALQVIDLATLKELKEWLDEKGA